MKFSCKIEMPGLCPGHARVSIEYDIDRHHSGIILYFEESWYMCSKKKISDRLYFWPYGKTLKIFARVPCPGTTFYMKKFWWAYFDTGFKEFVKNAILTKKFLYIFKASYKSYKALKIKNDKLWSLITLIGRIENI